MLLKYGVGNEECEMRAGYLVGCRGWIEAQSRTFGTNIRINLGCTGAFQPCFERLRNITISGSRVSGTVHAGGNG